MRPIQNHISKLQVMDSDTIFRNAISAADLSTLNISLQDCPHVDIESQNFVDILRLSIRNGDEAVFAKLLTYLPRLRLELRTKAADTHQRGAWQRFWDTFCEFGLYLLSKCLHCLDFYFILFSLTVYSALHSTGIIQALSLKMFACLRTFTSPLEVWVSLRLFHGPRCWLSSDFLFDTFLYDTIDGLLGFMFLGLATRFISPRCWLGLYLHEGLSSLISLPGLLTRFIIAHCMPEWRRTYFRIVFGPDNILAQKPHLAHRINHGDIVLEQLLHSECPTEGLMMRFLKKATFVDIKQEYGPGHLIFIWAAMTGSLEVVQVLLDLGMKVDTSSALSGPFWSRAPPPGSALFWAAAKGHSTVVQYLLRNGADPNHKVRPPLIGATAKSHGGYPNQPISSYAACVFHLLAAGAHPDSMDNGNGRSALSLSTYPDQKPILDLLLNAGANPDTPDKRLMLPIHYAAQYSRCGKTIEALMDKTTNVNALDDQGTSALTWSLWGGADPTTIQLLADTVSDVNSGGGKFGSPLEAASRYSSSSILRILLEKGADPTFRGDIYENCLVAALDRPWHKVRLEDDILCLELLLCHGADPNMSSIDGEPVLHIAARIRNHAEIIEVLLKHGADLNGVYRYTDYDFDSGTTPLGASLTPLGASRTLLVASLIPLFASLLPLSEPLSGWIVRENSAMALLKAGANPNCMTPEWETALQAACGLGGSSKLAKELIARGADIAVQSVVHHDTALHAAATAARSDIIIVLLEKGADANAKNVKLETPLHKVCWRELVTEPLREEKANRFEVRDRAYELEWMEELVESIELLLRSGQADPKAKDIDGLTPLHHAIKASNWLSVMTLMQHSPRDTIFETDSNGRLPLHSAAEAGFTAALPYLVETSDSFWFEREFQEENERESFFQAMRDSINAIDNSGSTALHHAARHGHEEFVAELRLIGGTSLDLDIRNHEGLTALDLAKQNNHVWLVSALKGRVV